MNTPICDFINHYINSNTVRMHMPGHKGRAYPADITEIAGADVLYHSSGIIRESESNAEKLFGTGRTVYSCEGSSLCIRAMLHLAGLWAQSTGRSRRILAGRNAHKAFMYACALLDADVEWIFGEPGEGLLSCTIDPDLLNDILNTRDFCAVYVTSPDYAGHMSDLSAIAEICHSHDTLLIVDNAHGAYLKFLKGNLHPMDAGADMCCDSAHKTLPVLTGGAYLHIAEHAPGLLSEWCEDAMALFASTSPSYQIMQSLDRANDILSNEIYVRTLKDICARIASMRERFATHGIETEGTEPMKITLLPGSIGYTGDSVADILRENGIECEYSDAERIVLMPSPNSTKHELDLLEKVITGIPHRSPICSIVPPMPVPVRGTDIRTAMLGVKERIPTEQAVGRILADACVSCPPAVPILIPGEIIDQTAVDCFIHYDIHELSVMRSFDTNVHV